MITDLSQQSGTKNITQIDRETETRTNYALYLQRSVKDQTVPVLIPVIGGEEGWSGQHYPPPRYLIVNCIVKYPTKKICYDF